MMANLIAGGIIAAIVLAAAFYVYKAKKSEGPFVFFGPGGALRRENAHRLRRVCRRRAGRG